MMMILAWVPCFLYRAEGSDREVSAALQMVRPSVVAFDQGPLKKNYLTHPHLNRALLAERISTHF